MLHEYYILCNLHPFARLVDGKVYRAWRWQQRHQRDFGVHFPRLGASLRGHGVVFHNFLPVHHRQLHGFGDDRAEQVHADRDQPVLAEPGHQWPAPDHHLHAVHSGRHHVPVLLWWAHFVQVYRLHAAWETVYAYRNIIKIQPSALKLPRWQPALSR